MLFCLIKNVNVTKYLRLMVCFLSLYYDAFCLVNVHLDWNLSALANKNTDYKTVTLEYKIKGRVNMDSRKLAETQKGTVMCPGVVSISCSPVISAVSFHLILSTCAVLINLSTAYVLFSHIYWSYCLNHRNQPKTGVSR